MQHKLTISTDLVNILGEKMYRQHPLPVVVRELVQNSRDAALRKCVQPQITVTVRRNLNGKPWVGYAATVVDNGIGMTGEQIVGDFLALGGHMSEKDHSHQTGGFGLAKVAIMRHPKWEVRTLTNRLNSNLTIDEKLPNVDGCTVSVTDMEKPIQYDTLLHSIAMCAFSDIEVLFRLDNNEKIIEQRIGNKLWGKTAEIASGKGWKVSYLDPLELTEFSTTFKGYNLFRVNGLVQWITTSYRREFNLLIDIDVAGIDPKSPAYPLNTSREEISNYEIRNAITNVIAKADTDKKSTQSKAKRANVRDPYNLREGDFVSTRRKEQVVPITAHPGDGIEFILQFRKSVAREVNVSGKRTTAGLARLDWYYDPVPLTIAHPVDRLLLAWAEVLSYVAPEPFGIGLTTDKETVAIRLQWGNDAYYILNPYKITEGVETAEGLGLAMFHLACHEASHIFHDTHDEDFTSCEGSISRATADFAAQVLPKIKTHLRVALAIKKMEVKR